MNKFEKWLITGGLTGIRAWRRAGESFADIAKRLGISERTLEKRCRCYPDLDDALSLTGACMDAMVEEAIFKRALGYTAVEVKTVEKPNGQTEVTRTEKEVAPDMSAATTWLKNRCPERWRDKQCESQPESLKAVKMVLDKLGEQAHG